MKMIDSRPSDAKVPPAGPVRKIAKITSDRIASVVMDAYDQPKEAWRKAMAGLIRNEGVS